MKNSLRFMLVFAAILIAGIVVNSWAYLGEAQVVRKPLKEFPTTLGPWTQTGTDGVLDDATMKVLRASDYLMRDFQMSNGQTAGFYVGYYATQRDGASFHSPLNCLPGSGWVLSEPATVKIPTASGKSFEANKYVIQNGDNKSVMIYWYQGRGRVVANEYWGKIFTVIDSVRLRRSDAAMVRVTVPFRGTEGAALASAIDMSSRASGALPDFVPD